MLESLLHSQNAFWTLTYASAKLPLLSTTSGLSVPDLKPKDFTDFLKRYRKAIEPQSMRYYMSAEYGDEKQRPHFHAAAFGCSPCLKITGTQYSPGGDDNGLPICCTPCKLLAETWGLGRIDNGNLTTHSAQYIAGYVLKKMTHRHDARLNGRHPEFSRMSLRPGIGADAMWEYASVLMQFNLDTRDADVPSALRHGKKELPLGRYLKGKLREYVGKPKGAPQETMDKMEAELFELYQEAFEATKALTANRGQARDVVFKNLLIDAGDQKRRNQSTRTAIFKQRKKL